MERNAAHNIMQGHPTWLSDINPIHYDQVIYPLAILGYVVGSPTLDQTDMLISQNSERFYPKDKILQEDIQTPLIDKRQGKLL